MSRQPVGPVGRPLQRLQKPKAGELLTEELAARIARGEVPLGSRLPSVRALVDQTGLSRTSVREALRTLEMQGLVEIRPGRLGGAYVVRPTGHVVAAQARLEMRGGRISLGALMETRAAVEPTCAALAAERRTEAGLSSMDVTNRVLAEAAEVGGFLRANLNWHVAIAVASGNELLSGLIEALTELIYDSTGYAGPVDEGVRADTCRAHGAITEAVREGDATLARHRMERHVRAYVDGVGDAVDASLAWLGTGAG